MNHPLRLALFLVALMASSVCAGYAETPDPAATMDVIDYIAEQTHLKIMAAQAESRRNYFPYPWYFSEPQYQELEKLAGKAEPLASSVTQKHWLKDCRKLITMIYQRRSADSRALAVRLWKDYQQIVELNRSAAQQAPARR